MPDDTSGTQQDGQDDAGQSAQATGRAKQADGQGQARAEPRQGGTDQRRRPQSNQGGVSFEGLPWVSGLINGVAYFVTAYIVAGLVFLGDIMYTAGSAFQPGGDFFIYGVGWNFYEIHLASVTGATVPRWLLSIPEVVYYLVPAAFLFLAGRSVARSTGSASMQNEQLAVYGATAAVGYLLASLVGAFALQDAGAGPDLASTVLFMGVVYPVVFGGLGGYLAKR